MYIESMARYENCQFIISIHSPFIMSMKNALLYNLDVYPATTMKWSEVESIRQYYEFFKSREDEFTRQNTGLPYRDAPQGMYSEHHQTSHQLSELTLCNDLHNALL